MNRKKTLFIIFCISLLSLLVLLMRSPYWTALTKTKRHFIENEVNHRILYEPGAKAYGDKIASHFSNAVQTIHEKQFSPFKESFNVYICASQKSLSEYIGTRSLYPVRGTALRGAIYLAPSAFNFEGKDTHKETLIHELSHLHFRQRLGFFKDREIPQWFREGFADYVSGSGGEGIRDSEAINYILKGNHFIVQERGGVFDSFQKNLNNLSGPMFHYQVKMFVTFLADADALHFKQFVQSLLEGVPFSKSFSDAMGNNVQGKWAEFMRHLDALQS